MNLVEIFYTSFNSPLAFSQWHSYLNQLPEYYHHRINRYRRWQDQHSALLNYLLLRQALLTVGYDQYCLEQLQLEQHGRPFMVDSYWDFNLSHSGEYVVCALLKHGRGGIDIERIKPIEIIDFKRNMSVEEWAIISTPDISYERFYDYWTMKESVMKADGRGLYLPLQDIILQGQRALVENTVWYLQKVIIHPDYVCHLATGWEKVEVHLNEVQFT